MKPIIDQNDVDFTPTPIQHNINKYEKHRLWKSIMLDTRHWLNEMDANVRKSTKSKTELTPN